MNCHTLLLGLLFIFITFGASAQKQFSQFKKSHHSLAHTKAKSDSTAPSIKKGIVPIPIIITDPNLGYGGLLAIAYIHSTKSKRKNSPPNITGIAGGGTNTKSWAAMVGHSRSMNNDDLRYFGGLLWANCNLDFYRIGNIDLSDHPIKVNLNGWGTMQQLKFRIGNSNLFIGPSYLFMQIKDEIANDVSDHPLLEELEEHIGGSTNLSKLGIILEYDSRDNTISPKKGLTANVDFNYSGSAIGSDNNFLELKPYLYAYLPINSWLYSSYRFESEFIDGDIPFYLLPYLDMRGVPALKYQGNYSMLVETQWRFVLYKSLSLLGFVGTGKAFNQFSDFQDTQWVYNYGMGIRYEFEKLFGLRVGFDYGWSNNDQAWYITIGTAW